MKHPESSESSPRGSGDAASPFEPGASSELGAIFSRLRAEPESAEVRRVALGLPTRVEARLRSAAEARDSASWYCLLWLKGLAPLTAAGVVWAALHVNELKMSALADPQAATWLLALFG